MRLLARVADALLIVIVIVLVMVATVAWARWYTDGTHDCANCSPE
jgi:hypothetical protein